MHLDCVVVNRAVETGLRGRLLIVSDRCDGLPLTIGLTGHSPLCERNNTRAPPLADQDQRSLGRRLLCGRVQDDNTYTSAKLGARRRDAVERWHQSSTRQADAALGSQRSNPIRWQALLRVPHDAYQTAGMLAVWAGSGGRWMVLIGRQGAKGG